MAPRNQLTPKESQVATLVWQGLTNKQIAVTIHTSEQVVKNYLRSTFDKLGVWSRLELAMYVAQNGGNHWLQRTADVEDLAGVRAAGTRVAERGLPRVAGLQAAAHG